MSSPIILTVSELTRDIKDLLENQFPSIGVRGEISNFKYHSSGHMYFTLKDQGAEISAVMFRGHNQYLPFRPENGLEVQAFGRITVFEKRGNYQIVIQTMEQAGVGALYQAFEALKRKLSDEGLFDTSQKKPLPKYPKTIGIITSGTGAAVKDILQVLGRRAPHVDVILRPTLVQGPAAAPDIVQAITDMQNHGKADLIIVGRGGGSIEDLWPFNEEKVARKIFESKIPIISAVGHETDTTIADFVSDYRAPTPSAAAEIACPSRDEILMELDQWRTRSARKIDGLLQMKWQSIDHYIERLQVLNPVKAIERHRENLSQKQIRMNQSMSNCIKHLKTNIHGLSEKLIALNPEAILNRGYSIARLWPGGQIIRSSKNVKIGAVFTLQTGDGSIKGERIPESGSQTKLPFE
ncbi:MAG: exodeoxyribonuclease VII large subunit [Candidatus Marinimicrobia bacterium]|nr:exodeoxyribonuclease VII large subunit [Candidatus Neomarinimicrobiota bacterium]